MQAPGFRCQHPKPDATPAAERVLEVRSCIEAQTTTNIIPYYLMLRMLKNSNDFTQNPIGIFRPLY